MNKGELIKVMAKKADFTEKDATIAYNAFIETITEALKSGDKVALAGFGTFEPKKRMERIFVSPSNGQRMLVPPKVVLGFKAAAQAKDNIKKGGQE